MTFQPVSRIYIISHLSIFKFISSYLNISVYPSSFSSSFPKSQVNSSAFLLGMSSCISYFPSLAPSVFPSELTSKLLPIWPSSLRKSWSFLSSLSYLFFIPTIKCFESIVNQSHPLVLYQHLLLNLFHFVLPPSLLRWNSSWGHQCFPNYRVSQAVFPIHSLLHRPLVWDIPSLYPLTQHYFDLLLSLRSHFFHLCPLSHRFLHPPKLR